MTNTEMFRMITRALTICALVWFAGNLFFLPTDINGALHHLHRLRVAGESGQFIADEGYWSRYYLGLTAGRVLTMMLDLWLALWLYRGASGVQKFFGMQRETVLQETNNYSQ